MHLLAFCTGPRIGEARGLLVEDVHKDHVVIQHSWEEGYGIKLPKNGRSRAVPIPSHAHQALQTIMPPHEPKSIVFYGGSKSGPLSKSYILNGLRDAIVTMKMETDAKVADMTKEELQKHQIELIRETIERRIGFHSWRHELNTILRAARVPDPKIRLLTGLVGVAVPRSVCSGLSLLVPRMEILHEWVECVRSLRQQLGLCELLGHLVHVWSKPFRFRLLLAFDFLKTVSQDLRWVFHLW
jgi:hypothetical protein